MAEKKGTGIRNTGKMPFNKYTQTLCCGQLANSSEDFSATVNCAFTK